MLKTIKMPKNLMNLTDNLPKPKYFNETKIKSKTDYNSIKNYPKNIKLGKTKYKTGFSRPKQSLIPLSRKLLKSREKHRELMKRKLIEMKPYKKGDFKMESKRTSSRQEILNIFDDLFIYIFIFVV